MSECRAHYESVIKKKVERDKLAKMTEEEKAMKEFDDAYYKIAALSDRITDILYLANKCETNGIKIPCENSTYKRAGEEYGYKAEFIAEAIHHNVGLAGGNGSYHSPYKCVMIRNGGACGDTDLIVTEEDVFGKCHHGDANTPPRIEDMKQFLKEFPIFEAAFYKWLDSLEEG